MSIVNEKKSELNERQLEAVNTVKGPVVIIAGPGTGKTKTLVERTVNILVNEKVEAKKIMITTFTNKAARELELRINESLEKANVNIDISDMYIGTMHSIWTRLIEENITYSDFFDNFGGHRIRKLANLLVCYFNHFSLFFIALYFVIRARPFRVFT